MYFLFVAILLEQLCLLYLFTLLRLIISVALNYLGVNMGLASMLNATGSVDGS